MTGQLGAAARRRAVPIGFAIALVVLTIVFWRPLAAWFGGPERAPAPAPAAPAASTAEAPAQKDVVLAPTQLSEPALSAIGAGLAAYEEARSNLAGDRADLAGPGRLLAGQLRAAAASSAPPVAAVMTDGAGAAERMAAARTLDEARREFGEVSRALVAIAAADPRVRGAQRLFSCPMVGGNYGKWLQPGATLENPYMGQAMLTCGSEAPWTAPAEGAVGVSHDGHGHRGDEVAFYTCSMHPSVQQKKPGVCPICAMALSPVTYDETESGVVRVDDARRRQIGLETAAVARAPMAMAIRAVGRLTYDETRLKDVTLKVKGWIARLRVNATGQPVRKGETLFALFSPELYAAQQEYLLALESQRSGGAGRADYLVAAAEKKLSLWDMSPAQIAALARRGQPMEELPVPSPASGYVIEKDVVEGAAVEPGQRLYRIASLDRVWVEAQVYELDLGHVRVGQKARVALPYQAGAPVEGAVAYVYPYLDPASRTGRVRIELANKDLAFKPDMYANVELEVDLGPRLQIPVDAVVYTGPRRLVFVDLGEGRLRPQEVTLGARNARAVEVTSGLREGDKVVASANFLIAAESRIRSAAELWSEESASPGTGATAPAESHAGH